MLDAGGHTAQVSKVLFSRDGKELLSVSNDKTIRVWDVTTGEPLRVLRPPIGNGSEGKLYAAALAPDGITLAVGGFGPDDNPIYLVSLATGRIERVLTGHEDAISGLSFDAEGRRLISGSNDQTARIWNVGTGKTEQVLKGHTNDISGVTFSPDGRRCATASYDKTAAVWNVATGERLATLSGHAAEVYCVAWNRDGQTLATGSRDHTIRLWRAGDVSPPSGSTGKTGAPKKPGDAAGKNSGDLRPPLAGILVKTFDKLGERNISSVTFTADSQRLLYTTRPVREPPFVAAILDVATGREVARFDQHTNTIMHGTLSPDGALAATAGGDDKEIFLWKTADGTRVHKLVSRSRVPWAAAWSSDGLGASPTKADGVRIAWGNTSAGAEANAARPLERTFDLAALEFGPAPDERFVRARPERGSLSLVAGKPNQVGYVSSVLVRQGDRTLATLEKPNPYEKICSFTLLSNDRAAVGTYHRLLLYDARAGKQLREFQGHTGGISAISPSPDGKYLLSAAGDMTLRVWDPDRDEPLLSCFFAGDDWIVWTPEGYYAASPGGETLMGWHVNNGRDQMASYYPASQFRSTLFRPDVIKLLLKTGSVERALEVADTARGRMTEKTEVADVLPPQVKITHAGRAGDISPPRAAGPGDEKTLGGLTSPARRDVERVVHVKSAELEVRATATSVGAHPVTALRLLLDDRPYQGLKGVQTISAPKRGEVTGVWQVTLDPGRHKLKVLADSSVSQGVSEDVEVVYLGGDSEPVRLPKLYVVAIGISEYPGPLKLNYAAKDAEALTSALKSHSKSLFRDIEVQTITDAKATRAAVLKGLSWLRGQMTQSDYGIFFFAGHGELDNDGSLYFLPVDADLQDLVSSAVPADQVIRVLSGIPGKLITILDACHSAGIAGSTTGKRRAGQGSLTDDLVRDLVTDENGVVAMCSSTGREFSLENNQFRQGTFTLSIVEGLSGKADFNRDGVVYLNELDAYVTDRVKELTRGQQHPITAKPGSIRSFPLAKP